MDSQSLTQLSNYHFHFFKCRFDWSMEVLFKEDLASSLFTGRVEFFEVAQVWELSSRGSVNFYHSHYKSEFYSLDMSCLIYTDEVQLSKLLI